ncbi:Transcription initiation factor TFIID subunit 10 [Podochytrium sp. JEL0797]|nr:Transcription initiation factor TFIID subunit 10 [Podochytrium sp. JEL0797]
MPPKRKHVSELSSSSDSGDHSDDASSSLGSGNDSDGDGLSAHESEHGDKDAAFDAKTGRQDKDQERREKNLLDLLATMEDSAPLIPDAVSDYYLAKAGFECDDVRIKRLLALATQKFLADITQDAFHYAKIRQQALSKEKKGVVKKTVLTMEDLSGALGEHGINIKKPEYFL